MSDRDRVLSPAAAAVAAAELLHMLLAGKQMIGRGLASCRRAGAEQ